MKREHLSVDRNGALLHINKLIQINPILRSNTMMFFFPVHHGIANLSCCKRQTNLISQFFTLD